MSEYDGTITFNWGWTILIVSIVIAAWKYIIFGQVKQKMNLTGYKNHKKEMQRILKKQEKNESASVRTTQTRINKCNSKIKVLQEAYRTRKKI